MKKSLSLLLAIAMVFSMFAAVASAAETPQERFDVLKEAGIFEGYPDGSAGLERQMTRAEFSKVLALLTDAPSNPSANTYTDVPATHWASEFIGAVTAAGLMNGVGLNKFDPNGTVTVEQVAATLVRALGLDEASGNLTGTYSPWAQGYIVAAQQAGLPIEGPNYKANALRSVLVDNAYTVWVLSSVQVTATEVIDENTVEVTFSDGEKVEVELTTALVPNQATNVTVKYLGVDFVVSVTLEQGTVEAAAIGANKIEVKFNRAVNPSDVTVNLRRANNTVNIQERVWASDNRSVVLQTSSKFVAGTYTVSVTGIESEAIERELTLEAEKVASVDILSDVASLSGPAGNTGASVSVGYQVLNQYGEDISATTQLNANTTIGTIATNPVSGRTLTINASSANAPFQIGQTLAVTLIHVPTSTVETATLTVSAEARVSQISVERLAGPANTTLTADTANPSDFYLVINAKDQYGAAVTDVTKLKEQVLVSVSNTAVASVNGYSNNQATFTTANINGVNTPVLRLSTPNTNGRLTAGNSVVTLIATGPGAQTASFTIEVGQGLRSDTVTFTPPGSVAAGEVVRVPVVVTDLAGNEITNTTVLNSVSNDNYIGVRVTPTPSYTGFNGTFVRENNQTYYRFTAPTTTGVLNLTALSSTFKATNLQINIQDAAVPNVITGIKDVNRVIFDGQTVTLDTGKLVIEDQYGRVINSPALNAADTTGNYKVVVTGGNGDYIERTGNTIASGSSVTLEASGRGSETLTFAVERYNGTAWVAVPGSATTVQFRSVTQADLGNYGVDPVGRVFTQAAAGVTQYNKTLNVFGLTSDQQKVTLPSDLYNAVAQNSNVTISDSGALTITGAATGTTGGIYPNDSTNEVTTSVRVTINATGQAIDAELIASRVAPAVETLAADGTVTIGAGNFSFGSIADKVRATDQYGVRATVNADGITFPGQATVRALINITDLVNAGGSTTPVITGNGTTNATIAGLESGDSFTVTLTINGKTSTTRVNVQ